MADDFDESLDRLYGDLTERETSWAQFAWTKERAFIDCYEASGGYNGTGLYGFWDVDHPQRRIIRSFRIVGAPRIAELLEESSWACSLVRIGGSDAREIDFGADRFAVFCDIERRLFREMEFILPQLRSFVEKNGIEARRLNPLGRVLTVPFGRYNAIASLGSQKDERREGHQNQIAWRLIVVAACESGANQ